VSFVFVNDGSIDDTGSVLKKLEDINPEQIAIINLPENSGKAEAVRQGVLYAIRKNFDCIGFWDADLSTPLSHIKIFIDLLCESPHREIVMGARVQLLGRSIYRKAVRHYIGRIFATAVSMILRLPVYDTQCGSKIFRNSPVLKELFEAPFLTKWIFDVEILARYFSASNCNLKQIMTEKIIEYPLQSWSDIPGSKIKLRDFAGSGLELARIWFYYRKNLRQMKEKSARKKFAGLNVTETDDLIETFTSARFTDLPDSAREIR
jgi:glycosyltransferase involved in cell wall biosynthesis